MLCGIVNTRSHTTTLIDIVLVIEFKNPLHTVPVFEDGDFVLHDSHAILQFLADTYGKNDDFYPKESKQRAKVNQILFFEVGYLFKRLATIMYPAWIDGVSHVTQKLLNEVAEAYGFVEEFLSRNKYIATDNLTIADISAVATVTSLNLILPLNAKEYPKTHAWIENISKQDFYQKQNLPGVTSYGAVMKNLLKFP